jgi:threonine dehydrogenase-like Zn-dependent dehydrogenase
VRAVAIAEDRTLQPTTMEERALGANEARVAVAFCGICGSDLHLRHSPDTGKLPADSLITATAPLERAQEMFERLESPVTRDVKILLSPAG